MTAIHTAFFGDGEHAFRLTPTMIEELERNTGFGIGTIVRHVVSGQFHRAEIAETIRTGLIGGGMLPDDAKHLADTYVTAQPLVASQILAAGILGALWSGAEPEDDIAPISEAA